MKYTGLKYDDDCGFYAVKDGKIVIPAMGISGTYDAALAALTVAQQADLEQAETSAQKCFDEILTAGGAGSTEATEAHAVWMAARSARATQDAQDAQKASEGYVDVKFSYAPTLAQYVSSDGWEL